MTTNQDPDEIRREIERTRANLSQDVNALADEAKPANVVKRQVEGVKEGAQNIKEKIFGSSDDEEYYGSDSGTSAGERMQVASERVQQAGEDARQAVQAAPGQLKQRTRGNPLAAGLMAFGLGALIGSLIPASQREQQLASDLKDKAQPAVDAAKDLAKEAAQNLQPQAQQAVQTVKESATDSAQVVAEEGKAHAEDVRDHAAGSADDVKGHATEAAEDVRAEASSESTSPADGSSAQRKDPGSGWY